MDDIVRAHVRVSGRVQGVFFRQTTAREAEKIGGVTGWVKNLADGDVEAVIEGRHEQVEKLVAWCHHGPPASRVDNVSVSWEEPTGEFTRFSIDY